MLSLRMDFSFHAFDSDMIFLLPFFSSLVYLCIVGEQKELFRYVATSRLDFGLNRLSNIQAE